MYGCTVTEKNFFSNLFAAAGTTPKISGNREAKYSHRGLVSLANLPYKARHISDDEAAGMFKPDVRVNHKKVIS
jgi:hypothetical protein